jgi:hypothetical protein
MRLPSFNRHSKAAVSADELNEHTVVSNGVVGRGAYQPPSTYPFVQVIVGVAGIVVSTTNVVAAEYACEMSPAGSWARAVVV